MRPQIVLNLAFWPMEEAPDGPNLLDLVQNAPSGWSPQVKCNFDPIYCILELSRVPNIFSAYIIALRLGELQRSDNGSVMPTL